MMKRFLGCLFCLWCGCFAAGAQTEKSRWVDSVFQAMTADEKLGQLFMVQGSSEDPDGREVNRIRGEIKSHHIGGVYFTTGGPVRQVNITNAFQEVSDLPLFIAQDAEWGLGMSLDSTVNFPRSLVLGAIQNDSMIYTMAREVGREMNMLGVHINFAPVVDVSPNPENPFTGYRSFGSDKFNVANKAVMFMQGLQAEGILACAKHFAFKGMTITNFDKEAPVFNASVDSAMLYPFQRLFKAGLKAVIPASVEVPLFYEKKNLVRKNNLSSNMLSAIFTGEWLKRTMDFDGLVVIDIPAAQNLTGKFRNGEAELFAFQAGNDILLNAQDVGPAIRKIKKLMRKDDRYTAQLDNSVKKILAAKYDAGLWRKPHINTDNLVLRLNTASTRLLSQQLYAAAITVVQDKQQVLPIVTLEDKNIAFISTANEPPNQEFYHYLKKYTAVTNFSVEEKIDEEALYTSLSNQHIIIAAIYPQISDATLQQLTRVLKRLMEGHQVVVVDMGHETFLRSAYEFPTIIAAYVNSPETIKAVPQVIFGGLPANGKLPYSPTALLKEGSGKSTRSLNRFSYSIPEDAMMDEKTLAEIDKIANEAIAIGATPGCNVIVARKGKVIYEKSYGYLTYDKKSPVTDETIYDLASVTKVSATLQAVMFMYERGLINVNKKASVYLPELRTSNKKDFTLKDILTHQAGLWPFLPFWAQTMKDSVYLPEFYSRQKTEAYPFPVAENLYASAAMKDSLWSWIVRAKIREKPARTPFDYRYSDMGFYIMQHVAEKLLNQPMEDFLQQNLYEPLGATTMGYLPLQRFPASRIAPTEKDKLFRKSLLVGAVHDQGAAMHGGVAGHAGLFSNATDLAKLGQMLLQNGNYGGTQFYKPSTVHYFTQKQFETSRRGLGWDKPTIGDYNGPTSLFASPKTFGHTGFTGTCIWVDPEFDLVYVFLSNRVHPDMTNNKLLNANIRSRIQDVIYQSIFRYCPSH